MSILMPRTAVSGPEAICGFLNSIVLRAIQGAMVANIGESDRGIGQKETAPCPLSRRCLKLRRSISYEKQ